MAAHGSGLPCHHGAASGGTSAIVSGGRSRASIEAVDLRDRKPADGWWPSRTALADGADQFAQRESIAAVVLAPTSTLRCEPTPGSNQRACDAFGAPWGGLRPWPARCRGIPLRLDLTRN